MQIYLSLRFLQYTSPEMSCLRKASVRVLSDMNYKKEELQACLLQNDFFNESMPALFIDILFPDCAFRFDKPNTNIATFEESGHYSRC